MKGAHCSSLEGAVESILDFLVSRARQIVTQVRLYLQPCSSEVGWQVPTLKSHKNRMRLEEDDGASSLSGLLRTG